MLGEVGREGTRQKKLSKIGQESVHLRNCKKAGMAKARKQLQELRTSLMISFPDLQQAVVLKITVESAGMPVRNFLHIL